MKREVIVLQHSECETLGSIQSALDTRGLNSRYVRSFASEPIPKDATEAAGLIVMGGPMGVYEQDQYPYLKDELRLIESFLAGGHPILGVCLGSQLLATALGATVKKGPKKEIGWHSLKLTESGIADPLWKNAPAEFMAFHWHGDIFDLPTASVSLASSGLTECQAFRHGTNVYGLLGHLEVTEPIIAGMVTNFESELEEEGLDGAEIVQGISRHLPPLRTVAQGVFGQWANFL
jgi:GMP synthase (glutamine-hydrolysing)